ncbi:class III lanthionine synthetase LanKC [Lactobacillus intestinalis]|uniref:Protein kinase domain-containing protein n=1 Tax=Lactobacillus intestinalis DSM 6629 TaxID=1423761 RepID=A0ABR5PMH5_9LACO|nr:class III lanthionine synthetase LanKC [Lactobacillus intestinalis]KRM31378.1 hypothetical protein FC44_GL000615 [Lactobacillus intestinalis DSM 6629]UTW40068.1 class III lanthionine synthetase LanKC [Lactobacillus intestinalis]
MKYNIEGYLPFTLNDKDFFSEPNKKANEFKVKVPQGWRQFSDLHWQYFLNSKAKLPDQGWKIHLSAGYKDIEQLLQTVTKYLVDKGVTFKVTIGKEEWILKNSKSADRVSSGKFITIYPQNDQEFKEIVHDVSKKIASFEIGPYILSDKRYKNTNIYYRYGAFTELRNDQGILCIRDENGNLIPDSRQPFYQQPNFVEDPLMDEQDISQLRIANKEKLDKYHITGALQFSNAGGVYVGEFQNKNYVLKEGRLQAGIDSNYEDGFSRIKHESDILKKLQNSPYVVNFKEYFPVWIHNYLVEEYLPYENLGDYITDNFPFHGENSEYLNIIKEIAHNLIKAIKDVHSRGIAVGDLQPDNILINENKNVILIDFEQANNKTEKYNPGLKTTGFVDLDVQTYGEADWIAVYKTIRHAFLPIINIDELSDNTSESYQDQNLKKYDPAVYKFLMSFKKECYEKISLESYSLNQKAYFSLDLNNLEEAVKKIRQGIKNNLDFNQERILKGDISQYLSTIGMFNILNGGMGLGLILSDLNEGTRTQFLDWFEQNKAEIWKGIQKDSGLFTGAAGIGSVIYSNINKDLGKKIIDQIDYSQISSLSLKDGLAGIGLALLALNQVEPEFARQRKIKEIARNVNDNYDECPSAGLLDGKLGLLLFLEKVAIYLQDSILFKSVESKVNFFIKNELHRTERGLYLMDETHSNYLPYLNSGSAGLEIVILEFIKDGINIEDGRKLIESLSATNDVKLTYMNGIFDGFCGLMLADLAAENYDYSNALQKKIHLLNNYLVIKKDEILVPGRHGLKNSMDLDSGAIGVLLTLQGIIDNDWGQWLPIIHSAKLSILKGGE